MTPATRKHTIRRARPGLALAAAAALRFASPCAGEGPEFVGPPLPPPAPVESTSSFTFADLNPLPAVVDDGAATAPSVVTLLPSPLIAADQSAAAPAPAPAKAEKPRVLEKPRPLGTPREPTSAAGVAESVGGGAGKLGSGTVRTALALGLVLTVIFVLAVVAKRMAGNKLGLAAAFGPGGPSPSGLLEILGRYPVGRGQTLVLLKVDRRVLLLSQQQSRLRGGGASLTTLCEVTDPDEVASILTKSRDAEQESVAAKFRSLLTRFDTREEPALGDEGYTHLRAVRTTEDGDRAELWDDRAEMGGGAGWGGGGSGAASPFAEPVLRRETPVSAGPGGGPMDGATALRKRLDAMRGGGGR